MPIPEVNSNCERCDSRFNEEAEVIRCEECKYEGIHTSCFDVGENRNHYICEECNNEHSSSDSSSDQDTNPPII